MLRQVFYVDITEVAQTGMQGDISEINTFDFQTLHQLTTKVQAGCRSSYRTDVYKRQQYCGWKILLKNIQIVH